MREKQQMKKLTFNQNLYKLLIFLTLCISFVFSTVSVEAIVQEEIEVVAKTPISGKVQDVPQGEIPVANVKSAEEPSGDLEEIPELEPEVKPKSVLFKFAIAILWVIISSLIIYFSLMSYKRISSRTNFGIDVEENTLNAPKNFKEAINLFLKKTKD